MRFTSLELDYSEMTSLIDCNIKPFRLILIALTLKPPVPIIFVFYIFLSARYILAFKHIKDKT